MARPVRLTIFLRSAETLPSWNFDDNHLERARDATRCAGSAARRVPIPHSIHGFESCTLQHSISSLWHARNPRVILFRSRRV